MEENDETVAMPESDDTGNEVKNGKIENIQIELIAHKLYFIFIKIGRSGNGCRRFGDSRLGKMQN